MPLAPNTHFDHYEIIAPLGAGGMGEVYLAEDARLRRKIALKILPESIAQDKDRLRRFEQEAFAASALNHPNILTIYEFSTAGATHYLASEFIDGETLRDRLQRAPLSVNEALNIAVQTMQALAAAHEANIIHRDIKPENVMIRRDGIVKVLDFGLAKLTERNTGKRSEEDATLALSPHPAPSLTEPGTVMGTVAYMSPEQARGNPVDARTDIFSLGVMLYEMLTRRQPFTGETINHVIVAILEKEPPPLAQNIPAELVRILKLAMAKKADDRYASAQTLLADLKKLQMRLLMDAEHELNSSSDKADAVPTIMLKQTTVAQPEALATAGSGQQMTNPKSKWWLAGLLSLVVFSGGFFGYRYFSTKQIESIAVMPFENKSSDADSDYLSDGLAESLIYRLSQLPDLKVSPTSSVFRYKGKATDPQIIAKELGVDSVLTGRLTQRGDNLTISVNLVDTRNGKSLWGEQYERKMSELLSTQKEIAAEITNNLKLKLSGESEQKLAKRYTANNQAYQLYLKGRFYFARRGKDDILKGVESFKQAINLDPTFALAYAAIAESYNALGKNADLPPREIFPQAKAAATRALELDPTLAEAHGALADSLAIYDWNWTESESEFGNALQLDPNVSYIHLTHGASYLVPVGKRDEAVAELKRAIELEPLSLITNAIYCLSYLYAGQNDKALEQGKKTYDLDPNFRFGRQYLGYTYIALGRYDDAIRLAEEKLQAFPFSQEDIVIAGLAYAKSGRRPEAERYLDRFRELAKTKYVRTVYTASIYAALGDKDKAFAELEKSFADKDYFLPRIKLDPFMDPLRNDPRFKDLLKRMGLPE